MSFTPGPWIVEDRELQGCDILAPVKNWSNNPVRIANAVPFANALANANLIAAAPELYTALKAFDPGEAMHVTHDPEIVACSICAARRAIAKAEGKQP